MTQKLIMLSILIPTYNHNVYQLVKNLYKQLVECRINFEILTYDDGSNSKENIENLKINGLKNCLFKELPNNLGRSSIRNLLAADANYENLLFIDAGTFPKNDDFIKHYISKAHLNVLSGGMTHLKKKPKKPYKLRWLYTKKRESLALCSSNFFIKKNILNTFSFDESLKNYGYEDVLFFNTLSKNNIRIYRINNPVIHNADDDANTFIKKTELSIKNLIYLIEKDKIETDLTKIYFNLKKLKLNKLIIEIFKISRPLLFLNFNSSYPSIMLFDFYRLGYFCLLKTKE